MRIFKWTQKKQFQFKTAGYLNFYISKFSSVTKFEGQTILMWVYFSHVITIFVRSDLCSHNACHLPKAQCYLTDTIASIAPISSHECWVSITFQILFCVRQWHLQHKCIHPAAIVDNLLCLRNTLTSTTRTIKWSDVQTLQTDGSLYWSRTINFNI